MNHALRGSIDETIEQMFPSLIQHIQKLVSFDTTAGNELAAQEWLCSMLKARGLDVDMWVPDAAEMRKKYPFFKGSRESFEGSPNVVGIYKGTGGGRSLIINGHIDVVPVGNLRDWSVDPFGGVIQENKIIGRGVSDMKNGHAIFLFCLDVLKKLNIKLKGDLLLESVIDEETGGAGTLAAAMRGYHADAAIFPESVGMNLCPASSGVSYFKLYIKGKAEHGSMRYKGVSAIEKAIKVINALNQLEIDRAKRLSHPLIKDNPIPFAINIGTISGGSWPSMVPDSVVLEGRYGFSPRETIEDARKEMEDCLCELSKEDDWFAQEPVVVEWTSNCLQSGEIPADHDMVKLLSAEYERVMKQEPNIICFPGGTDGGSMNRQANTPAVIFGPGSDAHCANESIDLEVIKQYVRILIPTIIDWCGMEPQE